MSPAGASTRKVAESDLEDLALLHFAQLGYECIHGPDIAPEEPAAERAGFGDVVLRGRLEEALYRLNPEAPDGARAEALRRVLTPESATVLQNNRAFHRMLRDGVEVEVAGGDGQVATLRLRLVDYDDPDQNDWVAVNQFTIIEGHYNRRPDVIVMVNGLPLAVLELKNPGDENASLADAYKQLQTYQKQIPSLFTYNALLVISDGEARVGTISAGFERFAPWRTVDGQAPAGPEVLELLTLMHGMFDKRRLLELVRSFVVFEDTPKGVIKKLAGYHQVGAVREAIAQTVRATRPGGDRKVGVVWHTQGSGKSLTMTFYAGRVIDEPAMQNPTVVVITDRNDLDDQLFGQFSRCARFLRQKAVQAESRRNLQELLEGREANGIIFTTMQKFSDGDEPLCDRSNVVVMVDEAHRGQYGLTERINADGHVSVGAARVVRKALPNASYIGFTGTPISTDDRNTREIFGDYIDVYDMTQSVEDESTKPVYYESRVVSLHLDENALGRIDAVYKEFADQADEASVEKSKHDLGGLDAIFDTPETIDALCRDIVDHYENNRADVLAGKALIVAYSRPIAMKIYYRIMELRPEWKDKVGVVMTMSNQDPEEWFDVCGGTTHKKEMERRFKDDSDSLKIAIVVDMWLTGFDVPSLSTMYVFKPMKGHNLMQAIARVNRVCKGKEGGLVVDYIGIAGALKRAMKDYTSRDQHNYGDMNIAETAYPKFLEKLDVCRDLMYGFNYRKLIFQNSREALADAIAEGTDWLLDLERHEDTESFLKQCQLMNQALSLCKSMVSEEDAHEAAYLSVLRVQVLRLTGRGSGGGSGMTYTEFNKQVSEILQQSVHADGVLNLFEKDSVEISLFDEAFLQEVAGMKEKNIAIESLKRLIKEKVRAYGRTSVVKSQKFSEMLQNTLNAYLNGMLTNAQVIEELVNMAKEIMKDRDDAQKLGLSDEEMAFYDAITQPQAVKDFYDNDQLVSIARELTDAMRSNATIDWQKKESARAGMRRAIKRLLRKYKYPPEGVEDAMKTVMEQCELWADTKISE